jgi:hypothetical protein
LSGLHPDADRWRRDGARWLEHLVMDQFGEDGWYVQHSLTYLRMALDQLVVAQRVLVGSGERGVSAAALARLRAAVALLVEVHDGETGDVPNHGANDGSIVLPISTSSYRDFRPAITAAATTFGASLPRSFHESSEALAWLGAGDVARHADPPMRRIVTGSSGWVSARNGRTRVFARAGDYESNPSHIDPAHVDVWIDGQAQTVDAGTYRYTALPPWRNGLAIIGVHNTVDIPSLPAATKGMRFLWLERPAASVSRVYQSDDALVLELRNQTWADRGVMHQRRCILTDSTVDIFDEIDAGSLPPLEVHVHWLLPDGASLPDISTDSGSSEVSVTRASPDGIAGWWSPHYGERRAALSVSFVMTITGRQIIHTRFLATKLPSDS